MIVDPASILRGLAADLRSAAPVITVGDLIDIAVMQLVEDGRDWRDLTLERKEPRYASSRS